ncbi:MAG: lysylphosphatidylglycerol synthase domain-containing protein [Flavobacteriaceae bacterium]
MSTTADGPRKRAARGGGHGALWRLYHGLLRYSSVLIGVAAISLAAFLLFRLFQNYSIDDIVRSIGSARPGHLAAALGFAGASYLSLTGFDYLALRYAGTPLNWRRAALASFCGLSIGHNVGLAALSSGAVRYRFYSSWGLQAADVAKVIAFCGLTVGLGMGVLGGIVLVLRPSQANEMTGLGTSTTMAAGAAILAVIAGYLVLCGLRRRPFRFFKWTFSVPSLPLAIAQLAVGATNFALVGACLHQAIAGFEDVSYFSAASAFVIANTTALIAHVPGGLGIIETVVLKLLPASQMLAAVLLFRLVYFLVPLPLGIAALAIWEGWRRHKSR